MGEDTYIELINLVSPLIRKQDTVMRKSISPHETLTATLRFLATGRSLKDQEYSKPSLSILIPEMCEAIYQVLKNFIQVK